VLGATAGASSENFDVSFEYPLPQTPKEHSFKLPSVSKMQITNGGKTKKLQ